MCGFVAGTPFPLWTEARQREALSRIAHRGPDSRVLSQEHDFFMGHARLAVVGGKNGVQPLKNEHESIFAVVNGEFYDHQPLRKMLCKKGHRFGTASDSELLVHLYEEFGISCLDYLHGEFAFVLYDRRLKQWFCARDRLGVRPVHYYVENDRFCVASEAKALIALGVPAVLDRESVWFSQHLQYMPQGKSLFKDIRIIRPGHYLLVSEERKIEKPYWSLAGIPEKTFSGKQEIEEHVRTLLNDAVRRRIPEDVPWACHLSGGLDSSLISALSSGYPGGGECFTVRFTDDSFYDESDAARATANHLGARLHEVPVSFEDLFAHLPKAVFHAEGLSINGHLGAKYALNDAVRKAGFKVVLTGEGADELFMGYSHLKQDFLGKAALSAMETGYLAGVQLPSGETLDTGALLRLLGYVPAWVAAKASIAHKLQPLWHREFRGTENPYEEMILASDVLDGQPSRLKRSSHLWAQYCLSGYILKVLDDGQSAAHGLEGRLPFLDTPLMEFMWSVPDHFHFEGTLEKALLRNAFHDVLPLHALNRPKQSFMAPPATSALLNPSTAKKIKGWVLESPSFEKQQVFDRRRLESFLVRCTEKPGSQLDPVFMTVVSLALFCETFLP